LRIEEGGAGMAFKCPVPGCEDSGKEFQIEAMLKSHIRNIHPDFLEAKGPVRKVPTVGEDFHRLGVSVPT